MLTPGGRQTLPGAAARLRPPPRPAADGDRARPHRRLLDPHALVDHRDPVRGLRHDGPGQGPRATPAILRSHAFPNALLPTVTLIAINLGYVVGRRHHGRGRVQLAGPRDPDVTALDARDYPLLQGDLPAPGGLGRRRQPRRRPRLRLPRSAGARMSVQSGDHEHGAGNRALRRRASTRRRRVLAPDPRPPDGLVGVAILFVFTILLALFPTLFVGPLETSRRRPACRLQPPSAEHLFGTDELGRDMLNLDRPRRPDLDGHRAPGDGHHDRHRRAGRDRGRLRRRPVDTRLMRVTDFFLVLPTFVLAHHPRADHPRRHRRSRRSSSGSGRRCSSSSSSSASRAGRRPPGSSGQPDRCRSRSGCSSTGRGSSASGGGRIMRRHILPNVVNLIVANAVLDFAGAPCSPRRRSRSSASAIRSRRRGARSSTRPSPSGAPGLGAWWYIVPPAAASSSWCWPSRCVGNALDDILNPKLLSRR